MARKHFLAAAFAAALLVSAMGCGNDDVPDATTTISAPVVTTTEGESSLATSTPVLPPGGTTTTAPTAPQPPPQTAPIVTKTITPPPATPGPNCQEVLGGWNLEPDGTGTTMAPAEVVSVRVGQHECFDRVVIDVATTGPVGSAVRYVDVVHQDGSGFPVPVAGNAALQVVVYASAYELIDSGAPYAYSTPNWGSLREVAWAGSFEGMTTFAIGVVDQNAFAVTTWEEHGIRKVIIDIAH